MAGAQTARAAGLARITAATLLPERIFAAALNGRIAVIGTRTTDGVYAGSLYWVLGSWICTTKTARVCGLNSARPPKQLCEILLKTLAGSSGHNIRCGNWDYIMLQCRHHKVFVYLFFTVFVAEN